MSKNFLDLINSQRAESKIPKFKGTFLEYLEVLSEDKDIVMLAHKRLHDVIQKQGVNTVDVGDEESVKSGVSKMSGASNFDRVD